MSNTIINQTRLHLGLTAGAKTDFVAADSYSFERGRSSGAVPQRSAVVSQLGDFRTLGYGMGCVSNARHDAVLRGFPRRLFHTAVPSTAGQAREGSCAVSSLVLNLGFDSPVTWTVGLSVDGDESDAVTPDQFEGIETAFHESEVSYFFGGAGFLADLTAEAQGGTLTGNYTVAPTSRRLAPGVNVVSQDVTQFGFTAALALLLGAESDKMLANEVGLLAIRRAAPADYAYIIPMSVTGIPLTAPIASAATRAAAFTQAPGIVVHGVPVATADGFTLTDGTTTYTVDGDSITAS